MKQWLDTADEYIKSWKIRDVALLKLCVCAAGFLFGMGNSKTAPEQSVNRCKVLFSL